MFSFRNFVGHVLAAMGLCIAIALLVTGCSLPWQKTVQATASRPTTQQLLTNLQKNFRNVKSFHVVMKMDNPGTSTTQKVQIRSADGDVIMPDKVKAQANVILSGQAVTVNLISVGGNQYITDPITGQWRVIKGLLDPRTLTNPDTGIVSLVGKVQNVSQPTDDSVKIGRASCRERV